MGKVTRVRGVPSIFGALAAGVSAALVVGCSEPYSVAKPATQLAAAPIRVLGRRVIQGPVNMMEPLVMDVTGDEISVTFATGKQDGVTLAVDPATLRTRVTGTVTYPRRPKDAPPPYLAAEAAHVPLVGGGWLTVWTDCQASRVYAQRFDSNGRALGEIALVSHADADVLGPARAATVDGKRVVVVYFATDQNGYELTAAAVDAVN